MKRCACPREKQHVQYYAYYDALYVISKNKNVYISLYMYVYAQNKFWKRILFLCGGEWDVEHWNDLYIFTLPK